MQNDFRRWNIFTSLHNCHTHAMNIAALRHVMNSLVTWLVIDVCKTSTNKLYVYTKWFRHTSFYIWVERACIGNPSSLQILPREIFAYISKTIFSTIDWAISLKTRFNMTHKRHAYILTLNLFRVQQPSILPKHANSKATTNRNQRFRLCLRLDNDTINKTVSPLSSLDAGQLFQAKFGWNSVSLSQISWVH
jgi:uncharacterized membrane protein YhdT